MAAAIAVVTILAGPVLVLLQNSESAVERGQRVYDQVCSSGHEADDGIGPLLSANLVRSYRTARTLFEYIKLAMPLLRPPPIFGSKIASWYSQQVSRDHRPPSGGAALKWCERCLCDHEGPCLDEHMRRDTSKAVQAYFEDQRIAAPVRHSRENVSQQNGPQSAS